ncbi:MAG: PSD1 and planctomycete cytochrome C domain-containing protein [Planctomycetaceae bacterium]
MSTVRHLVTLALLGSTVAAVAATPDDDAFFESRVRPLLVTHCRGCHSTSAGTAEGGLSFDSRAEFFGADGVAVAGRPDESLLVRAVRYDGDLQMPPDGRLPDAAVRTIEEWVRRGLPWPDDGGVAAVRPFDLAQRRAAHWCWEPPRADPPPAVRDVAWCRSDIDRFVLARLEAAGLEPAGEAALETLVRRASEALTGLPPAPDDVATVAAAADPQAFERYVDRLVASPHFGERFARHWLDVARYAETRGHEFDFLIPNAWQYRDWVVRAFNADLPYDQFVREQVAGDLVQPPRLAADGSNESVVGTGFWLLGEEVHAPVDLRQDEADRIDNRVDTFGKAFLGLTIGCARCHDHKFDAVSAADYYAIAGMVMSSSYRQVPFQTLEANRRAAADLAACDAELRAALPPLIEAATGRPVPTLDLAAADAATPSAVGETVIASYAGPRATPLIMDAAAWALVPAGQPVVRGLEAAGTADVAVMVEAVGHARSDAVWATTRTTGERDAKPLGDVDRAGRVLRTPTVSLSTGVLWHRVRGHVQIHAAVDSHVLLKDGPLYGPHVMTAKTEGEWKWIRQDLRRDIGDWDAGHLVHVEYAAVSGEAGVAETVAAADQPRRDDPEWPATVNALLAAHDRAAPEAVRLREAAARVAARQAMIRGTVRLESATAPALLDGNGIDQRLLIKGSAGRPGPPVPRRFLEAVDGSRQPAWPADSSGRLQLADRVLDPLNPLTARVAVNRIWHHLFGRGLVPTPDNFGVLGEPPADPLARSLLDTLAVRFREEGWSVKRLVREIVTSSTWRMSSRPNAAALARDPLNVLLHHHPVRRLEAEAIRDAILAVSGRLDPTPGGPSVEVHLTEFHEGRGRPASGPLDGAGRRSLYTKVRRNFLPPFLTAFDLPVPFQSMGRRNVTNVPAQALVLCNDPFVAEQATAWARKTVASTPTPAARIERMFRDAYARQPEAAEAAAATAFLAAQATRHGVDFAATPDHEAAWADLAHALITAKEFIFVP